MKYLSGRRLGSKVEVPSSATSRGIKNLPSAFDPLGDFIPWAQPSTKQEGNEIQFYLSYNPARHQTHSLTFSIFSRVQQQYLLFQKDMNQSFLDKNKVTTNCVLEDALYLALFIIKNWKNEWNTDLFSFNDWPLNMYFFMFKRPG